MSTWAELSQQDKQQTLEKIANVYELFNYPEWLKNPTINSTILDTAIKILFWFFCRKCKMRSTESSS